MNDQEFKDLSERLTEAATIKKLKRQLYNSRSQLCGDAAVRDQMVPDCDIVIRGTTISIGDSVPITADVATINTIRTIVKSVVQSRIETVQQQYEEL